MLEVPHFVRGVFFFKENQEIIQTKLIKDDSFPRKNTKHGALVRRERSIGSTAENLLMALAEPGEERFFLVRNVQKCAFRF